MKFQIRSFTLLETLLVLGISSFIIVLFSFSMGKTVKIVKGELFVSQFENIYKNSQFRASAFREETILSAQGQQLKSGRDVIEVPEEAEISDFSIKFDKYGNNSSLKKIMIYLPDESKTVIYQLEIGSGKYKKTIQ